AGGDARRALTALEAAAGAARAEKNSTGENGPSENRGGENRTGDGGAGENRAGEGAAGGNGTGGAGKGTTGASGAAEPGAAGESAREISLATLEGAIDRAAARYDRDGDQHYDVASALIKSIRGSDVDAALHYLARMVDAGEDPRFIA